MATGANSCCLSEGQSDISRSCLSYHRLLPLPLQPVSCVPVFKDDTCRNGSSGVTRRACNPASIAISAGEHETCQQHAVRKIKETISQFTRDDDTLEELILIDAIQRLGLDYYFQREIHAALERQYAKRSSLGETARVNDLHKISLWFRLLRQEGFDVSADAFNVFVDGEGNFKELCKDIRGLRSMFEASQLSIPGEDVLDKANEFSKQQLKASLLDISEQSEASLVKSTLKNPHHKSSATRFCFHLLEFLDDTISKKDYMLDVLNLAEIDYEMAQMSWRKEILEVSKWGEDLRSTKKLEFARIRPIKWYMWSFGTFPRPYMTKERIDLAKAVSFVYIIDDIFDIHGTLEELSLFTEAINRWEPEDSKLLPDYMKVCVEALHGFTNDFSLEFYQKHGWNPKYFLAKTWADLCNSFLVEAKWFASGQLPNADEYLKNGIVSSSTHVVLMHAFFLLGDGVNEKSVDEINGLPSIVSSTAKVVRLWNDIGTDKNPNRGGNDGSYIDCYMNEQKGKCSNKTARQHVRGLLLDAWKCLNQERLSTTSPFSAEFRTACNNFARMVPVMYNPHAKSHRLSFEKLFNWLLNGNQNEIYASKIQESQPHSSVLQENDVAV